MEIVDLSTAEATEAFDRIAHRHMGMSGSEFLSRWDAGQWAEQDFDAVPGLVDVWMSIPLVR